jgi:uncharacterized Tic20 family protein
MTSELDRRTRITAMGCHLADLPRLAMYLFACNFFVTSLIQIMKPMRNYGFASFSTGVGFFWIYLSVALILGHAVGCRFIVWYLNLSRKPIHPFVKAAARKTLQFQQTMGKTLYIFLSVLTLLLMPTCGMADGTPPLSEGKELLYYSAGLISLVLLAFGVYQVTVTVFTAIATYRGKQPI